MAGLTAKVTVRAEERTAALTPAAATAAIRQAGITAPTGAGRIPPRSA